MGGFEHGSNWALGHRLAVGDDRHAVARRIEAFEVVCHHVRLEVQLPWMLSLLANRAKALVQKQGKLMLEKPTKPT